MASGKQVKRILILGANGQIGRMLFEQLSRMFANAEIIGAVRARHFHFEGVGADARRHSVIFDIAKDQWRNGAVDVVVNCIGAIEGSTQQLFDVHVNTTAALLRSRAEMGNPAIIQVSALGADSTNPSVFLRSKAMADALLLREERTWVIRPSVVCTPGTVLVQRIRSLRKLSAIAANNIWLPQQVINTRVQPIMPGDLSQLIAAVITEEPAQQIINAAGADEISFGELFAEAGMRVHRFPGFLFAAAARLLKPLLRQYAGREQLLLMGISNTASTENLQKLLGRKPQTTRAFWKSQLDSDLRPRVDFSTVFA
jgi:uncharacterized protein YbjT (DUF2867 family)